MGLHALTWDAARRLGLGRHDAARWTPQAERDVLLVTHVIAASALLAYAWTLRAPAPGQPLFAWGKLGILALIASSLGWMAPAIRAARGPWPAAAFWGVATLASAVLDHATGHGLVDVLWSLIPGYLAIAAVGFFVPTVLQLAGLGLYALLATLLLWSEPRAVELQVALCGMVVAMGGANSYLYRRSVHTAEENARLHRAHLRNLARVLPEPIAQALASESDLRALMRPRQREVVVVSVDVRGSTPLLRRLGAERYAEAVRPMIVRLLQHARRLEAFAKFEGDGLLVVFGAFDDHGVDLERIEAVMGFLQLAHRTVCEIDDRLADAVDERLRIGMGAASGTIVAGSVGSIDEDLLFDVIGEPIAYACRLEAFSKLVATGGGRLRNVAILSDKLATSLQGRLPLRPVRSSLRVRDFEGSERVWELDLDGGLRSQAGPRRAAG